jgi:hypothetical protein
MGGLFFLSLMNHSEYQLDAGLLKVSIPSEHPWLRRAQPPALNWDTEALEVSSTIIVRMTSTSSVVGVEVSKLLRANEEGFNKLSRRCGFKTKKSS